MLKARILKLVVVSANLVLIFLTVRCGKSVQTTKFDNQINIPKDSQERVTNSIVSLNHNTGSSHLNMNVEQDVRFGGNKWRSHAIPNLEIYRGAEIIFSKRFGHKEDDFSRFVRNFNPDRLAWHYVGPNITKSEPDPKSKPSIVLDHPQFKGNSGNQCAINVFVGKPFNPQAAQASYEAKDLQCIDLDGNFVFAPWEVSDSSQTSPVAWASRPDVLKDDFILYQSKMVSKLIESGCSVLQQDSVSLNYETFKWGGCFSREGDTKFRKYLLEKYSRDEINNKIIAEGGSGSIDDFSIKKFFIAKGGKNVALDHNGKRDLSKWIDENSVLSKDNLLHQYRDFSNLMTLQYLQTMKAVAKAQAKRYVPLSGNVAFYDENYPLYHVLDFIVTEWVDDRKTPLGFVEMVQFSEQMGKQLVGTPASDDVGLHRSSFASAYAMGIHMILPFDVYVGTTTPFAVGVKQFKDMTDFVRDNKSSLEDTFGLETYGSTASEITSVSKKTKLINGRSFEIVSVKHARSAEFESIPIGSEVVINGKKYDTVGASEVGVINLSLSDWNQVIGSSSKRMAVEAINTPAAKNDLRTSLGVSLMPKRDAPRVHSVDFGHSKPGYTTVRLTHPTWTSLPSGTKVRFSHSRFLKEIEGATEVGNLYFRGNIIDKFFPGQAIASLQIPNGEINSFEYSSKNSKTIELPQSVLDVLVSVRRKDRAKSHDEFIHIVNWNSDMKSLKLKMNFSKVFGFDYSAGTVCKFRQTGGGAEEVLSPRAMTSLDAKDYSDADVNGRFIFDIANLKTWGILTCR